MWNNVLFGFLLIATVCTQCQSIGYPKVKPDNPLELPTQLVDKTNVKIGSVIQNTADTAQNDMPEQVPSDDTSVVSIGYPKVKPDNPLELPTQFFDRTNIMTGSVIQQAVNTPQDDTPEQVPSDDNLDKTIAIPEKKYQVIEHVQEDQQLAQHADVQHPVNEHPVQHPIDEQHVHVQHPVDEHHVQHPIQPPVHADEHHHHHGEDGAYNPHDDGTGWDIRKSVPGEPGRDYPTYDKVVDTSFTCGGKAAGYYADLESRCQIFRICTTGSVNAFNSFLCPNGSLFNQAVLTCDWWPNVDCEGSASHYNKNNEYLPPDLMGKIDVRFMLEAPLLHPYKPVQEPDNNHLSDTKIFNDFQVTQGDEIVSKIRYTTPIIQTPTTSAPIIQSTIASQQYQTGTYDVYEKPTTDSSVLRQEISTNTDGNVLLVSSEQNKPVTFDQMKGPEKISLLTQEGQKEIGLLANVIGTTQSGSNVQSGSSVDTSTEKQIIGGLNLANDGRLVETAVLNTGADQTRTFGGISKSIELPGTSEVVQNSNGGLQQHYARILSHGNEQNTIGAVNVRGGFQQQPDQTVKQYGDGLNQQSQLGTHQQGWHNQALSNFAQQAQNIHNQGIASFPAGFNQNFQTQGVNFGLQNQQQSIVNTQQGYQQGFTGETQTAGLQNQQGYQSNYGLNGQNGYNYNQGFTSDNQGGYNLAPLNQNTFIGNQNAAGAGGFNPNYHEQTYQNFNYHANNNGPVANYEVSKNGAAQHYNGESLSQHANGHTHASYSGQNYAYKQSTKVEVVPSLGFTLTDELGRASYASALINGLVQEKRGASAADYASALAPTDARYSSYQGPSSYLVPQSSVQHLTNAKRESNNPTT